MRICQKDTKMNLKRFILAISKIVMAYNSLKMKTHESIHMEINGEKDEALSYNRNLTNKWRRNDKISI